MQEFYDETFTGIDFSVSPLPLAEFEQCHFVNCKMTKAELSGYRFLQCRFTGCDLSLASFKKTVFQEIVMKECKLLGLHFDQCSGLGLSFYFEHCTLNHSSFHGVSIKGSKFSHCQLEEVDFTDADLTGVSFQECNLGKAVFENSILLKADFTSAYQYSIDPEKNKIKGALFSLPGVTGLLDKYGIRIQPG